MRRGRVRERELQVPEWYHGSFAARATSRTAAMIVCALLGQLVPPHVALRQSGDVDMDPFAPHQEGNAAS